MRKPDIHAKELARMPAGFRGLFRLAIMWFLVALPTAMQAQFTFTTNNGALTITGYTGSNGTVVIPSATNGLPVTAIGANAFAHLQTVTNLTIPGSITNIGPGAFYECFLITNVSIGSGLLSLADSSLGNEGCFAFCTGLRRVMLPASVTNVGTYAFFECSGLTNLVFSGPTIRFGSFACAGTSLKNVAMPSSVSNLVIDDEVFAGCTTLTNFLIGTGVSALDVGAGAFTNCPGLASITLDPANPFLAFSNGVLFDVNQTMLIWCSPSVSGSYVVPNTVARIQDNAFFSCTNLTGIDFPSGLTTIGHAAFRDCSRLSSVDVPAGVVNIETNTFASCLSLTNAILGDGVTNIGDLAFFECTNLLCLTLSRDLFVIGNYAFEYCYALTNMVIPDSVYSIGTFAFDSCFNANFVIGNGVRSIGDFAFNRCIKITNLTLPQGVVSIGNYGFWYCSGLTNVIIPPSVTNIGVLAFANCVNLSSIFFEGNAPAVDNYLGDSGTVVYYLPGTTGWSNNFGALPALLWNPQAQTTDGSFGVSSNGFGFNITGTTNIPFVVEAAASLGGPWVSLQSVSLTNGSYFFSDPQWTNYSSRFYRFRSP